MTRGIRVIGLLLVAASAFLLYFFVQGMLQARGLFYTISAVLIAALLVAALHSKPFEKRDLLDSIWVSLNFYAVMTTFQFIFSNQKLLATWHEAMPFGAVFVALAIGYLFYLYRLHLQFFYGATELFFALLLFGQASISVHQAGTFTDDTVIKALGSLYVIVRGLDNMEKGVAKRGPFFRFLVSLARLEKEAWREFAGAFTKQRKAA